ncbi:phosphonate ABC transporter ATP-binding protein [Bacillus alkalicellulosilyticus]|uniref:phosphonate ABC transporter ATP-binding protein n=1 Tax=Alkalihalobacterium alkalicellulosilyticum TaxID=1912214 RepID=UPI000996A594|nr:phosphonate ABC transporter ATP-binding protein [Bacillus alkalicellulosilyticus]
MSESSNPVVKIENVTVQYKGSKDYALAKLSLSFYPEEFVCILGKSGAGKSTFIRTINGLHQPTSGTVTVHQKQVSSLAEHKLKEVRQDIAMIFQHYNLIPRLSVLTNVLSGSFGRRPAWKSLLGIYDNQEILQAEEAISAVELDPFIRQRVERLSGGQKQRVGIARALLQHPRIFLGDEPVASLDPSTANKIFSLLKKIHQERKLLTIINVHDVTLAKRYATRIIGLHKGELVFDGTPEQLTPDKYKLIYGDLEGEQNE